MKTTVKRTWEGAGDVTLAVEVHGMAREHEISGLAAARAAKAYCSENFLTPGETRFHSATGESDARVFTYSCIALRPVLGMRGLVLR